MINHKEDSESRWSRSGGERKVIRSMNQIWLLVFPRYNIGVSIICLIFLGMTVETESSWRAEEIWTSSFPFFRTHTTSCYWYKNGILCHQRWWTPAFGKVRTVCKQRPIPRSPLYRAFTRWRNSFCLCAILKTWLFSTAPPRLSCDTISWWLQLCHAP